ncbi:hypothetical protein [uncultured Duncaniella sp.]|uniref:hypothetical protein n=1 Tax=uncultured Duncaniella sp. TaxID=2768039 RepID=UPI00262065D2|nr:hypothetical protein [uncultured Duncaniella sp.]
MCLPASRGNPFELFGNLNAYRAWEELHDSPDTDADLDDGDDDDSWDDYDDDDD